VHRLLYSARAALSVVSLTRRRALAPSLTHHPLTPLSSFFLPPDCLPIQRVNAVCLSRERLGADFVDVGARVRGQNAPQLRLHQLLPGRVVQPPLRERLGDAARSLGVAAQDECDFFFSVTRISYSRPETRRFRAEGKLNSTCAAPRWRSSCPSPACSPSGSGTRCVALQVAFERQTLKPVFLLDRL
jgi:hypothetical protein